MNKQFQFCLKLKSNHQAQSLKLVFTCLVYSEIGAKLFQKHLMSCLLSFCPNPFNNERSCGGSSGGDGGLVAARCVPFALGSDIGGSIRIPSLFNGICGLKPTNWRLTSEDNRSALDRNFTPMT